MCCDGTLYTYVTLVEDDMPRLEKYPQLRFIERNHQQTFDEGCVLHTGTGCSAYEDRPDTCRRYRCALLRAVEKDEMSEHEALKVIAEAKALVENVKASIAFEPGKPLAVGTWEAPPVDLDEDSRLAWDRTHRYLGRHFLGEVPAPT